MSTLYDVIKRPIVTEKGVAKKDAERTLCFEVERGREQDADQECRADPVQDQGGRRPHVDHGGQIAPPGPFRGVSVGLEKGVCAPEGRRKNAGVRGDLSHGR